MDYNSKLRYIGFKDLQSWSLLSYLTSVVKQSRYNLVKIGSFLKRIKKGIAIQDDVLYKRATIKLYNAGIVLRDSTKGKNIGTKKQFLIKKGQLLLSKIDARNGAFGIVPQELDGGIITGNFWVFDIDTTQILPEILCNILSSERFQKIWSACSNGTTNRHYLQEEAFLNTRIPVPSIEEQNELIKKYHFLIEESILCEKDAVSVGEQSENILFASLNIFRKEFCQSNQFLSFINYNQVYEWGADKNQNTIERYFEFKQAKMLKDLSGCIIDVFRGKSPIYSDDSKSIILNQKCNRWDYIDTQYAKTVDEKWLSSIEEKHCIREGDIIINSTGEGTLGRASLVGSQHAGLCVDSHMLVLRLDAKKINPEFIVRQLNSSFGQKQVELLKGAQATKQTELGIDNILKIKFIIPTDQQGKIDIDFQKTVVEDYRKSLYERQRLLEKKKDLIITAKRNFQSAIFS